MCNKDDLVWKIIGGNEFCCFKYSSSNQNFCQNKFNLTGFCSRQSCPLANNKYATIIEKNGILFLYFKKSLDHNTPSKTWKKVSLSRNIIKGIQQIDLELAFWPKFFINKTKFRLIKLTQALIRSRLRDIHIKRNFHSNFNIKLTKKNEEFNLLTKLNIENTVERELLIRLHMGVYGENYGIKPIRNWTKINNKNVCKIDTTKQPGKLVYEI
nr:maintenance of killer 16, mak16-like protein [Cryptomonas sp.]